MDNVLKVEGISASWEQNQVLNNVSLSIKSGELVCLTGANGCGKSTLMTIMSGIQNEITHGTLKLTQGSGPFFNNKPLNEMKRKEAARHISYMTQTETSAWNYNVKDIILSGRFPYLDLTGRYSKQDYSIVEDIIKSLHIENLAGRSVFELSGGEYQKVRIARSLAQNPEIMLLDEPVANLDFGYQDELMHLFHNLTRTKNIGILIVIHDINTAARYADRLVLLPKKSCCISGSPSEVLTEENLHKTYPANNFGIFNHPYYNCPQIYIKDTAVK